tara:strand:- start:641 stop:1000 length:360 start_codon:yes stop_codon:yes gene_type:complete
MVNLRQYVRQKKPTQDELLDRSYNNTVPYGSSVKPVTWEYKTSAREELVKTWPREDFYRYLATLEPPMPVPKQPIIYVREKPCLHEQIVTITVEMIDGPVESVTHSCTYCGEVVTEGVQ